jgi:hypothetical protein
MDKASLQRRAGEARTWALERWSAFRAESPYFQAKVGLVAAYVVIVLLTVLLAPPKPEPWVCREERIPFGLSFKTAIEITNVTNGDLDDVTVEVRGNGIEFDGKKVPGVWQTKALDLVEGEKAKVLTEQLFDRNGANPPYSLDVETVTIFDDDKKPIVTLHPQKQPQP